jgi:hypothetical protein
LLLSAQRIELSVLVRVRVLPLSDVFVELFDASCMLVELLDESLVEVVVEVFVELFDESLVDVFVELLDESLVQVFPESDVLVELFELSVVLVDVVVVVVVEPGSATCAIAAVERTADSAKAEAEAMNLII